jgi:hypothetical protein
MAMQALSDGGNLTPARKASITRMRFVKLGEIRIGPQAPSPIASHKAPNATFA